MLTENIKGWIEASPLERELNVLARRIMMHDTTYEFSDSLSTWRAGSENHAELSEMIKDHMEDLTPDELAVLNDNLNNYKPEVKLSEVFAYCGDSTIFYLINSGMMGYFEDGDVDMLAGVVDKLRGLIANVTSEVSGMIYTRYCPSKDSRGYSNAINASQATTSAIAKIADILSDRDILTLITGIPEDMLGFKVYPHSMHGLDSLSVVVNGVTLSFCVGADVADLRQSSKSTIEGIIRVQRNRTLM